MKADIMKEMIKDKVLGKMKPEDLTAAVEQI